MCHISWSRHTEQKITVVCICDLCFWFESQSKKLHLLCVFFSDDNEYMFKLRLNSYRCSAASDYRKRRKSEPSSRVNAPLQGHAANSLKPVNASRAASNSLKKPAARSSPSSPSRAKGNQSPARTSPLLPVSGPGIKSSQSFSPRRHAGCPTASKRVAFVSRVN